MILTCPDCSTRYSVKDDAIGPNGRMVRCSTCKSTWYVAADPETLELQDNQAADMTPTDGVDAGLDYGANEVPNTPIKPAMGAHVQIRDKADQKRRNRRLVGVSLIWLVTLGLLTTAAALAYVFRQDIVDRTPEAATLYKAVGISVKADGLDFEKPKTKNMIVDGRSYLVVNGYIRNRTSSPKPIPFIELSLLNASNEEVASWLVEVDQPSLPGKDRIEYTSQYPNPPLDAVTLEYKFVDDDNTNQTASTPVN